MQPHSWSPSHLLSPTLPCSFSICISHTELPLPAVSIYKYHQFTPLVLWSNWLFCHSFQEATFPSKNVLLSVFSLSQIVAFFIILLAVSMPLAPTYSNPLLSPIFSFLSPSLPSELCQTLVKKTHRSKHRKRRSTHTHTHGHMHAPQIAEPL